MKELMNKLIEEGKPAGVANSSVFSSIFIWEEEK